MNFSFLIRKVLSKTKSIILLTVFQYPRVIKYRLLSNCKQVTGKARFYQPTQLLGAGCIKFGSNVSLGVRRSPFHYSGYGYIESRKYNSSVFIMNNVSINNNFTIISEGEGIEIGDNTLIGLNFEVADSDFHDLHSTKRIGGTPKTAKVTVGKNVFIGSNVKVMKGVNIGDNSVIANGSIVTKSIPANVIAGGYPAKMIKNLEAN